MAMNLFQGLASFEDVFPFLIPLVIFMIPIVAILTAHQRKMAEIMYSNHGKDLQSQNDIQALQQEMRELKHLLHQQTIAIDNLVLPRQTASAQPPSIEERLKS